MSEIKAYNNLGKAILVVNPVAQSGKCKIKGQQAFDILTDKYKQDIDLQFTDHAGHALEIASQSEAYDSIIAVGGDGVVHEIANGLMRLPKEKRPKFGVLPVGSGNDYARSLGMSFKIKKAVDQLMHAHICAADVGKCNDQYFVETLSFGLDAGIAIDTMEARKKHNSKGFKLYFKCGLDRIKNHYYFYNFKMKLNSGEIINGRSLIMAIQIGKTYGSGFKVTPKAEIDDGYFDICYTKGELNKALGLSLFARAAKGLHVNNKHIGLTRAKSLHLSIDRVVPCQLDGEKYENTEFDIETIPLAITVFRYKK